MRQVTKQPVLILIALMMLVCAGSADGQIYKFVDENGIINYTGTKPNRDDYVVVACQLCKKSRAADYRRVPLNTERFAQEVDLAAHTHQLDAALLRAVIHVESWFDPLAVSRVGAQGLMQLMPATGQQYGIGNPFDASENISVGSRHLRELIDQYNGDERLALAAYNAGAGAVRKYNGVPPYRETRDYIERVSILRDRYASAQGQGAP